MLKKCRSAQKVRHFLDFITVYTYLGLELIYFPLWLPHSKFQVHKKSDSFVVHKLDVLSACMDGWQKINVIWVSLLQFVKRKRTTVKLRVHFAQTQYFKNIKCVWGLLIKSRWYIFYISWWRWVFEKHMSTI